MVSEVVDGGTTPKNTDSSKTDQPPSTDHSSTMTSSKAAISTTVNSDYGANTTPTDEQLTVDDKPQVKKNVIANYFQRKADNCAKNASSFRDEVADMCSQVDCRGGLRQMCTVDYLKSKLPITQWLPKYTLDQFQGDLIAGVTVGLTVIPQSLAYAKIAELPPQYGLYSAFMCCFVYMLLGTSRDVAYGPTAVMSLLTAEFGHYHGVIGDARLAILLTFVNGIVQIVMAITNIGFVVDYISHPVINSFTTAAAITIACSQLKKWLGLKDIPRGFVQQLIAIAKKLPDTKIFDFLLGSFCMIMLYSMKKMKDTKFAKSSSTTTRMKVFKYLIWLSSTARNVIVVLLSTSIAAILYHQNANVFSLTGKIVGGIPPFGVPQFSWSADNETFPFNTTVVDNFKTMGIGVIVVPVLGVIETIAIGKAFGRKNNYNVVPNQELLAIGFSNLVGSFFSSYPITASFSRSAVNGQSGVQTPAGNIYTGVLVLLALAFLTPLFYYIPDAALAAVIIMAVTDMIDFSMVPLLWRIKKVDLLPWLTAFFISLLFGFEYGIIIGVTVSLLLLLYPWSRPRIQEHKLKVLQNNDSEILLFTIDIGLMFSGIEYFEEKVYDASFHGSKPASAILDLAHVSDIDFTAVHGMQQLNDYFAKKKAHLVICNLQPGVKDTFERAKLKNMRYAASVDEAVAIIQGAVCFDEAKRLAVQATGDDILLAAADCHDVTLEAGRKSRDDGLTNRSKSASKLTRDGSVVVELTSFPQDVNKSNGAQDKPVI